MFYFIKGYQLILVFFSMLLILYAGVQILGKRSMTLIKTVLSNYHVFKEKNLLILSILLVFLLNCFMVPLKEQQNTKAEISLNYTKASQGLNPNGSRYNPSSILNTEVLERAIQKGAFQNITAKDLRKTLRITPKIQGASYDESAYFISTQFVLSYYSDQNTAHLNGETLLSVTAEAYKEWFITTYSENTSALNQDLTEIEDEDYLDIARHLKMRANLIANYMERLEREAPSFQSSSIGETFQSIVSQARRVEEVMAERLEAYLLENGVSKSPNFYQVRLSFQNVFSYFDSLKAERSNQNNLEAISMYEDDMAQIVLVPTYDTSYQFYMSQTRIGIDDFAKAAESYANKKSSINNDIAQNDHVIQQLSMHHGSGGTDEKAQLLIEQMEGELKKLEEKARILAEEYNEEQANNYISIHVIPLEEKVLKILVKIFFLTLLFAVSVYCISISVAVNNSYRELKRETAKTLNHVRFQESKLKSEKPVKAGGIE